MLYFKSHFFCLFIIIYLHVYLSFYIIGLHERSAVLLQRTSTDQIEIGEAWLINKECF